MIEIFGTALNQWDTGRSVQVTEIEADHVHFANKGDSKAVIMDIAESMAKIPDYLLQTGKQLCVYAVKNGVTIESEIFYVKTRERPESYVYEEDQRNYIYKLISDAETAIEEARGATTGANLAAENANRSVENSNIAIENANKSASGANLAAENANKAADKVNHTAKNLMVIGSARGNSIHLDDAIDQFFVGMRIFGKTTQDGTPTPEAPVDLVSSADGNHLSVHVCGKNLFTGWEVGGIHTNNGLEITGEDKRRTGFLPIFEPRQKICVSGIPNTMNSFAAFYDSNKGFISRSSGSAELPRVFDAPDGAKYFRFTIYESASLSGVISEADAAANTTMIEAGASVTEHESGKQVQTAAISTLNGLRGIPVTSGGNYTDANGQQWFGDEIDLTRGVRVQRCFKETAIPAYNTSNNRYNVTLTHNANLSFASESGIFVMCDKLPYNNQATSGTNGIRISTAATNLAIAYYNGQDPGALTLVYPLATPIETPLSDEELAAYAALRTYRGNTTVSNDAGAWMDLEYVMDAKKYIDSLLQPSAVRIVQVKLLASAWVGSGNLYSQVVSIDGITENSQVNLTPSVQQLSIFYEKDITFSTENDGGVVTVYVIGQKPQNDYTIQADIVEVIA